MFTLSQDYYKKLIKLKKSFIECKVSDARVNDSATRARLTSAISTCLAEAYLTGEMGISSRSENFVQELQSLLTKPAEAGDKYAAIRAFVDCMGVALVVGYFHAVNTDIVSEKTPDFGYKGLGMAFDMGLRDTLQQSGSEDALTDCLTNGLRVSLRDCTPAAYFETDKEKLVEADGVDAVPFWQQDIDTLFALISADIDDGYNKRMLKALKDSSDVSVVISSYFEDIIAVYDLLFEDSFGLEFYKGVLAKDNVFLTIEDDKFESSKIAESPTLPEALAKNSYKLMSNVDISRKRQFDYDEIFSSSKVVYFPRKILEYARGRETTINSPNSYAAGSYVLSWENYKVQYLLENVESILYRGVYKALERLLKKSFIDDKFMLSVTNYAEFVATNLSPLKDELGELLGKLSQSMRTAFILTGYPIVNNTVTAIKYRVCFEPGTTRFDATASVSDSLFRSLVINNKNEVFDAPVDLATARLSGLGKAVSVCMYEYQFDINPKLAEAEPLFGYVVQEANRKKNKSAGWDSMLIGLSRAGKELYASEKGDIPMRKNFIHNIYAGSRCGKGVMTMNILANALASGKPIFYLDRKPDMASMMYSLSEGKMFVINGGQYTGNNDSFGCFDPSDTSPDKAMYYWNTISLPYLREHPEIAELFDSPSLSYEGNFGDYIYFRACMFCFALCALRCNLKKNYPALRDALNGDNGIIVVMDEFTNFQGGSSGLLGSASSKFLEAALNVGSEDELLEKKTSLEAKIRIAESELEHATPTRVAKAEENLRLARMNLAKCLNEKNIYAATLYSKIRADFMEWKTLCRAGFQNEEFLFSDFFVLGQKIDSKYVTDTIITGNEDSISSLVLLPTTIDKSRIRAAYDGCDFIRSFLEQAAENKVEDWFFGAKLPDSYMSGRSGVAGQSYIEKKNWGYIGTYTLRDVVKGSPLWSSISPVLFKPYLVLNTHFEPEFTYPKPAPTDPQYGFVWQCSKTVFEAAGNVDMWPAVRKKHIDPLAPGQIAGNGDKFDNLNEGIGFNGLVKATLLTTPAGKQYESLDIKPFITETLGKSGALADIVANAMGYDNWQQLIFDFSKEGMFSFADIFNAVTRNGKFTPENRFPLYAKLGLLGTESRQEQEESDPYDYGYVPPVTSGSNVVQSSNSGQVLPTQPVQTTPVNTGFTAEEAARRLFGDGSQADSEDDGYSDWDDSVEDSGSVEESTPAPVNTAQDSFAIARDMVKYISGLVLQLVSEMQQKTGHVYTEDEVNEIMTLGIEEYRNCMSGGGM